MREWQLPDPSRWAAYPESTFDVFDNHGPTASLYVIGNIDVVDDRRANANKASLANAYESSQSDTWAYERVATNHGVVRNDAADVQE